MHKNKSEYVEQKIKSLDKKPSLKQVSWEEQVYRNINNLCVYCGKPMTTTVFFDVPVCDEHKDEK